MSSIGQENPEPAADEAAIVVEDNSDSPPVDAEEEEEDAAVVEVEYHPEPAVDEVAPKGADAAIVDLVTELKAEGTTLFRRRDYNGAASKFDEAIRCSPRAPARYDDDVASLHSNVAACYMHMTAHPEEEERHYHQAIDRCNMALAASPRYTKALLKRARCFEALDRLDLACSDVQEALSLEPNNVVALELLDSIKEEMEEKKLMLEQEASSLAELLKAISVTALDRQQNGPSTPRVNGHGTQESHGGQDKDGNVTQESHGGQDKDGKCGQETHVISSSEEDVRVGGGDEKKQEEHQGADSTDVDGRGGDHQTRRVVKFVLGDDDVRIAVVPEDCGLVELMGMARSKFPDLKAALRLNFKDIKGNLVPINSTAEIRWSEEGANSQPQRPLRLYVTEDDHGRVQCPDLPVPEHEPTQCSSGAQ